MYMEMLLALNTSAQGLTVKKSTIPHLRSGLGVFACRAIGKEEMVGHYYGSLVYSDLIKDRHKTKTYGEGMLQVTADIFKTWANELAEKRTDSYGMSTGYRLFQHRSVRRNT